MSKNFYGDYTIECEKDVVLAQPTEPEPNNQNNKDVIPCCEPVNCVKCKKEPKAKKSDGCEQCECDNCECCSNTRCGESCDCTETKNVCVYKYLCGEGDCNCLMKSNCPEDTLTAKNHKTCLENVKKMNENFIRFFTSWKIQKDIDEPVANQ